MQLTQFLKNYRMFELCYEIGTLSPALTPLFRSIRVIISSEDVFPVLKAHYIEGNTIEFIAETSVPPVDPRTIYRRQKAELKKLESIINGNWLESPHS